MFTSAAKKPFLFIAATITCTCLFCPALHAQQRKEIRIWPGVAPGSEHSRQKESYYSGVPFNTRIVRNVTVPTITPFVPQKPNGTAVVICPGGGYVMEELDKEGGDLALWLNRRGVTAFVLKYRVSETPASEQDFIKLFTDRFLRTGKDGDHTRPVNPPDNTEIREMAAADGRQAILYVRQHASEWGIKPDRIGILGFSAGGEVSVMTALLHDEGSKPDFAASIYSGLRQEAAAPKDAAPMFIVCASDDPMVNPANSTRLYAAWRAVTNQVEMHIYMKGGHGFGMAKQNLPIDQWVQNYGDWLAQLGLMASAR